jgi:hypothetical protein
VGPTRPTELPVTWRREDPPFAGPVEAVCAGLDAGRAPTVVLLAADAPLVDADTVARLVAALPGHEAAMLVDASGHDQYLTSAFTRDVLRRLPGSRSLRSFVSGLDVARLHDTTGAARDMDTWDDVAAVRAAASGGAGSMLKEWTAALAAELGVSDLDVDERLLLDVARDAAHSVTRPAAPITTFLVGYAAARAGGDAEAVRRAAEVASRLAAAWTPARPAE